MLILVQIVLQLLGFSLLVLSLPRHYSEIFGAAQRATKMARLVFKCMGFSVIIVAIVFALNSWGAALGLVYFFATATLIVTLLAILLAYFRKFKAIKS